MALNIAFYSFFADFCSKNLVPAVNDAKYMGIGMIFHFTLVFTVAATVILLIKFLYEAYKKPAPPNFGGGQGLLYF